MLIILKIYLLGALLTGFTVTLLVHFIERNGLLEDEDWTMAAVTTLIWPLTIHLIIQFWREWLIIGIKKIRRNHLRGGAKNGND